MLQFRLTDANAEIDFARARQVKRMRAYRPAFLAVDLNNDGSLSAGIRHCAALATPPTANQFS